MKAFPEFKDADNSFWALIKWLSEQLGYTNRKNGLVAYYSPDYIKTFCERANLYVPNEVISAAARYIELRADVINTQVSHNLMTGREAEQLFNDLYSQRAYKSKMIMNKQSGDKKRVNYFTAIITMIAESVLGNADAFDSDPRGLSYLVNNGQIIGTLSRRFDGAFPSISSPQLVWEIKEYYYTTTFGSRIADGVYETQLDGHELNEIYRRTGHKIHHVLFVDSYKVWWEMGKPYTVRLIDALNMGLVDDVVFGKEVLTEWPKILSQYL